MKKKKLNILLIIVVLIIWGVLIHRIVKKYFSSNTNPILYELPTDRNTVLDYTIKKDSFHLLALNRDPFLNILENEKAVIKKSIVRKKSTSAKNQKTVVWPKHIEYYGFIKSEKSKTSRALLRIDGVLYRVEQNKKIEDILLKSISRDSIQLVLHKTRKTIFKKKK